MAKKAKVLLLKPLQGKGNAGDIIDVKMHYANYVLIPKGIAVYFDKQTQNQHEAHKKSVATFKEEKYNKVKELIAYLEQNGLVYEKEVSESGSLYDSISNKTVLKDFKNERKIILANEELVFEKIETIGEYEATINYEDMKGTFTIVVKAKTEADK